MVLYSHILQTVLCIKLNENNVTKVGFNHVRVMIPDIGTIQLSRIVNLNCLKKDRQWQKQGLYNNYLPKNLHKINSINLFQKNKLK